MMNPLGMPWLQGLAGIGGYSQAQQNALADLARIQQPSYGRLMSGHAMANNDFSSPKSTSISIRKKSIREELQDEVNDWLRDID